MSEAGEVHFVVPEGIDDPARPSGGNVYDRFLASGLTERGWRVHVSPVAGSWPHPTAADLSRLHGFLRAVPDDGVVLIDGLVASPAPGVLVAASGWLRVVILVHMPLGAHLPGTFEHHREREVLFAAAAVVVPSSRTRQDLLDGYGLPSARVHVVQPGADKADLAATTASGGELLCVATVAAAKGHDVLVDALVRIADLRWHCRWAGRTGEDPGFVEVLRQRAEDRGIADRITVLGPLSRAGLDIRYAATDLLLLASRTETFGMVVVEALARGIPVLASAVGGVPEALGRDSQSRRPGLLVSPGDPEVLAAALRRWLSDPGLRFQLRQAARNRRETLSPWSATAERMAGLLQEAGRP